MQLFSWLSCIALAAVVAAKEQPTTLKIETTYLPDECPYQTQQGDPIKVHYTGRLFANDQKFDSSLDRESPFSLIVGAGQVIQGWDEGLKGMCLYEKRTLTIPSSMAYGERGAAGIIPPGAALVFDVELVEFNTKNHVQDREEL
ncbi:hypothetical protein BDZ94DRAFT_1038761 [Collybia nuda]|uniref:peptidylprolyl isomerase n=1 Tax=Collybia nuda TaxID=64659 RepID=A0A9P6CIJ4_9AGAR|nr:hypothetical protein BDZ94DRAFT_1038761 [Collybia nuda]